MCKRRCKWRLSDHSCGYSFHTGLSRVKTAYDLLGVDHMTQAARAMLKDDCPCFVPGGRQPRKKEEILLEGSKPPKRERVKSFDEQAARQMHADGFSDREIAEKLGADQNTIGCWRRREKLPPNFPHRFDPARALQTYRAGATDTQIAELMDLKPATIRNWRQRNGLLANVPGRYPQ